MEEVKFRANGRNQSILYKIDGGKWKSTGKKTFGEARDWYYHQKPKDELTLRKFAENFFTDESEGSFRQLQKLTGRYPHESWWHLHNIRLNAYILPKFGDTPLYKINTKAIQWWYVEMQGIHRPLGTDAKKKILDCLSVIMDYAVYCELITVNPCKAVIKNKETHEGREPFTQEELAAMFPENDIELFAVWGNLMWATYYMIMRDTGWRPSEIAALTAEGYIEEQNGIYTTKSVDSFEKKIQNSVKTSEHGYRYRIGILTERTGKLLKRLIAQKGDGLLFTTEDGGLILNSYSRKVFKERMKAIGINTTNRPPYALRTTFMTNVAKKMDREQVEELMGHRQWRSCYDKRSAEDILKKVLRKSSGQ